MGRKRHLKGNRPPKDPFEERRAAALKALKELHQQGSFKGRPPGLVDMLSDESDRGAVILVGCLVEDLLADRIIEKLPNGEAYRDELLRQGGLFNSFQAKMTMGKVLGIIDTEVADELEILRIMRNACAHSKVDINLRTPQLRDVFSLLIDDEAGEVLRDSTSELGRVIFNFIAIYYFELLLGATREMAQAKFEYMFNDMQKRARTAAEKHQASLERRHARRAQADPQSQKDQKP